MTTEKPTPPEVKKNWSFEQFMRQTFKGILDTIAAFLLKLGLTPNLITTFGLVITIVAAVFAALGRFPLAGLILLIGTPLDAVDGAMARKLGTPTRFGGFFDSVMDRYSELFILGGLLVYYNGKADTTTALLVYIAAAGSLMVSYTRARAEGLQLNARVGFFSRLERMISLILFLLIGKPEIAIWLIAILANFTAIQRILFVHRQAKDTKVDAG